VGGFGGCVDGLVGELEGGLGAEGRQTLWRRMRALGGLRALFWRGFSGIVGGGLVWCSGLVGGPKGTRGFGRTLRERLLEVSKTEDRVLFVFGD